MSENNSAVTSESEFRTALCTLTTQAYENGVSIEGGWTCRSSNEEIPDWDVTIMTVEKPFPPPDDR